MMRRIYGLASLVLSATLGIAQGGSDVLELNNGDKITGTVKTFAGDEVVFETPMVGELKVPKGNIANLTTAAPVTLVVRNPNGGTDTISRRITSLRDGTLTVEGGTGTQIGPIRMSELEAINPPEDDGGWTGSVNIGAYNFSGNTDRRGVNAAAQAQLRMDVGRITGDASWDYAQDKNADPTSPNFLQWNLTQRRVTGGLQYDHFLNEAETSYAWISTRLTGDTLADIKLRAAVGGGYGHQWVERDDFKFSTELGLSYLSEEYRSNAPSREYLSARVAYRLFKKLTETMTFLQYVEAFPSVEEADDVLVQADSRLQMSLTETMFAEIRYDLIYDNTPSPGRDRADHRVFATLGWSF